MSLPALILLLAACRSPEGTVGSGDQGAPFAQRFLPDGQGNHLLPQHLALDAGTRRLVVTSHAMPALAWIDLDKQALDRVTLLPRHGQSLRTEGVALDPHGVAWIAYADPPALVRVDDEQTAPVSVGLTAAQAVGARQGGGAFVLGSRGDEPLLVAVDALGHPVGERQLGVMPLGFTVDEAGAPVLVRAIAPIPGSLALQGLDPDTLEDAWSCEAPSRHAPPTTRGHLSWLGERRALLTWDGAMLWASCMGWSYTELGSENRSAVPVGEGALVFDRLDGESENPHLAGRARPVNARLHRTGTGFPTGKNSAWSVGDPQTGLVWFNVEGSTEVWAMDPVRGERKAVVPTGLHLEFVLPEPKGSGAWFTGRLSDLVGHVDGQGGLARVDGAVQWPVAPTLLDGRLYVLAELSSQVVEVDPTTLQPLRTLSPGLPANGNLVFSYMAASAERGTLLIAEASSNRLVELDPGTGAVVGSWELAGAALDDPDRLGRLELRTFAAGAITVRSSDGAATLVHWDQPRAVAKATLPVDVRATASEIDGLQRLSLQAVGGLTYYGGAAFQLTDLGRREDRDLPASLVLGPWGPAVLIWRHDSDGGRLILLDEQGRERWSVLTQLGPLASPHWALAGKRAWVADMQKARLQSWAPPR